ncbi:MAG: septation ring formation regulator EzrA [Betaproteobacteria bacterium]|nr:septation ring formation regulator EzrA [Betaproteobacteria bacterium]
MRWITVTLMALLVLVQADLWFSRNGVFHVRGLQSQLGDVRRDIDAARGRNEQVQAEVHDLREGLEMVEEKARAELGMVKRDEIYIQVTPQR